jgi:hypothetical protein
MEQYIEALGRLCRADNGGMAPYLLRTRVERSLYGLLNSAAKSAFGCTLAGLDEGQVRESLVSGGIPLDSTYASWSLSVARSFEKFTYLCDTSNWSNDGQDPRIELCRDQFLQLCDEARLLCKCKVS